MGQTQEPVKGFMYGAFTEQGQPIEFSSQNGTHKVSPVAGYVAELSQEINVVARIFQGKVKYRELAG